MQGIRPARDAASAGHSVTAASAPQFKWRDQMKQFDGSVEKCGKVLLSVMASAVLAALLAACGGGGGGTASVAGATLPGALCAIAGAAAPTVTSSDPSNGNLFATTSTAGAASAGKLVTATFSLDMNPATLTSASFTLTPQGGAALVPASVTYDVATKVATLTTTSALALGTTYTATISKVVTGVGPSATPLGCIYAWTFKTASTAATAGVLGRAGPFGGLGGTSGAVNVGALTTVTGDFGTAATVTSSFKGFHDATDTYTEVALTNVGAVSGKIYSCALSTTGPNSAVVDPVSCQAASDAVADARAAYTAMSILPGGQDPGGSQLGGLTLAPGLWKAPAGSFQITGTLTLDASGDPNAVWIFQMPSSTLTLGDTTVAGRGNVALIGGAQAKNVFWQVGSSATINGIVGGGTMVGTIIASAAISISTTGVATTTQLNGRAISLNASTTMNNAVIVVP
jgi:hypothetical protein